jgi:hypothetical protein
MAGRSIARLVPHPSTTFTPVDAVTASLAWTEAGALAIAFRATGAIESLRIPPCCAPARAAGLWCHTCFEAFVMAGDGPPYHELNFSPSGEWAAYAFRGYRDGGLLDAACDPGIVVRCEPSRLALDAVVAARSLPVLGRGGVLRLGLAAVFESVDGVLFYWALRHAADRPDFHRAETFTLALAPPEHARPGAGDG